jgi:ATP-dependent helicase HrpB
MIPLPIDAALGDLKAALGVGAGAVLQAPPGSGKTTRVPLALLDEPWLAGRRIVMLEPRRLAARNAATYMAGLLGEPAGRTVGYRVRMDTRVGPQTRIEVVTEGVLTRLMQHDACLAGTGLVIFDEFHERRLESDMGLALCLDLQGVLNPDLKVLVMSAMMETGTVAALLGAAPQPADPSGRLLRLLCAVEQGHSKGDPLARRARALNWLPNPPPVAELSCGLKCPHAGVYATLSVRGTVAAES